MLMNVIKSTCEYNISQIKMAATLCILFLFLLSHIIDGAKTSDPPVIQTAHGPVRGKFLPMSASDEAAVFLGIPYAAAPVGNLRFARPEPPQPWKDVKDCLDHPPRCIQMNTLWIDYMKAPPAGDSEDCLTLNVFTANLGSSSKQPVMVFIHGGAFRLGSTYDYRTQGIVDNLVSRGVVVVLLQYRLGLFGFLALNHTNFLGNWGLWDQVLALKWVQENIHAFGGDKDTVTLFGESSGAISISLLSYTPQAEYLFHRVIEMSGTGYTALAVSPESLAATEHFSNAARCTQDTAEEKISCLRGKPAEEILTVSRSLFESGYQEENNSTLLPLNWSPLIDGKLISGTMDQMAEQLTKKPAIIGTTNTEMPFFLNPPPQQVNRLKYSTMTLPKDFSLVHFEAMLSFLFPEQLYPNSAHLLRKLCMFHYLESQGDSSNQTFLIEQYHKMTGDVSFYVAATREAADRAKIGGPVWLYSFDYYNADIFPEEYPWKGAHHIFDLLFLFDIDFEIFGFKRTLSDKIVTENMSTLWTNFAKSGDPTKGDLSSDISFVNWPTFQSFENSPALHIGKHLEVRPTYHQSSSVFWNKLIGEVEFMETQRKEQSTGKHAKDRVEL